MKECVNVEILKQKYCKSVVTISKEIRIVAHPQFFKILYTHLTRQTYDIAQWLPLFTRKETKTVHER